MSLDKDLFFPLTKTATYIVKFYLLYNMLVHDDSNLLSHAHTKTRKDDTGEQKWHDYYTAFETKTFSRPGWEILLVH